MKGMLPQQTMQLSECNICISLDSCHRQLLVTDMLYISRYISSKAAPGTANMETGSSWNSEIALASIQLQWIPPHKNVNPRVFSFIKPKHLFSYWLVLQVCTFTHSLHVQATSLLKNEPGLSGEWFYLQCLWPAPRNELIVHSKILNDYKGVLEFLIILL